MQYPKFQNKHLVFVMKKFLQGKKFSKRDFSEVVTEQDKRTKCIKIKSSRRRRMRRELKLGVKTDSKIRENVKKVFKVGLKAWQKAMDARLCKILELKTLCFIEKRFKRIKIFFQCLRVIKKEIFEAEYSVLYSNNVRVFIR